jgi:hypothetical protein
MRVKHSSGTIPLVSKEIVEVIKIEHVVDDESKIQKQVECEIEECSSVSVESPSQNIGWGRWYSLKELENATDGFAEGNVIGEGGYGIVYRGILQDGSVVAVKNLLNNKYALVVIKSHFPFSFFCFISVLILFFWSNFVFVSASEYKLNSLVNLFMELIICLLHVK